MTEQQIASDNEAPPTRSAIHEALAVFLGRWRAAGKSYGSPSQDPSAPKSKAETWESTHTGRWHTGEFFLVVDERATTDGKPFDTLSVLGVEAGTGRYFARAFENHGFYREYALTRDGDTWTISGEFERARIVFSDSHRKQTITWEWRPKDRWLPLCDRVAVRED